MFTGDFHEWDDRTVWGKDGQRLRVVSPGSTCMQSIAEPRQKYFCVLYDDLSIKPVKLKTRPMLDYTAQTPDALEQTLEQIPDDVAQAFQRAEDDKLPPSVRAPLLRVTYSYKLDRVPQRVERQAEGAHLFFKEIPPDLEESSERRAQKSEGGEAVTLEQRLPEYLREHKLKQRLENPCQRLLQTSDVRAELRRMREEYIGTYQ